MKFTEKMLLDGFDGLTNALDKISVVSGQEVRWNYREGDCGDGYNVVCKRARASEITLEWDRRGTIALDGECDNHTAIDKMEEMEQKVCGTSI